LGLSYILFKNYLIFSPTFDNLIIPQKPKTPLRGLMADNLISIKVGRENNKNPWNLK